MQTTKTITIRHASVADKDYIDDTAITLGCSIADALSFIVAKAKAKVNDVIHPANADEANALREQLSAITLQLQEITKENEALKSAEPVTVEKEVEKIIEVPVKLTGAQFICDLPPQTADAARKLRKFIKQDGHVSATGDYANELVSVSVKHFINRNYSDLVKL